MAASFVVASNFVASGARAAIEGGNPQIDAGGAVSVKASDTSGLNSDSTISLVAETTSDNEFSDDNAMALGGISVRNVLEGGTVAEVLNADITGDSIEISAENSAKLEASVDAEASAAGGSTLGAGTQLAVNAVIASNTVLGGALAQGVNSELTANTGDVSVTADNSLELAATNANQVSSGDQGVGVMLAFNTLGYESQNILFQALDA